MNSVSDNDRFDDLINEIDHTDNGKRNRSILLSFLLSMALGLIVFMSFSSKDTQEEASINTPSNINSSEVVKVPFDKINTPPYSEASNSEEVVPVGIKTEISDEVNTKAEPQRKGAQFPGGSNGVAKYLKNNIIYPDEAFEKKIEGKVLVQITINESGIVNSPTIIEGLGYGCDEEVIRVLSKMPNWQPATLDGQSIKKSYILTVTFSLS